MKDELYKEKISAHCERLLEDTIHSCKGHYNAGAFWENVNLILGLLAIFLGVIASSFTFMNEKYSLHIAFAASVLSASVVAVMTFLQPQKTAESHNKAGSDFNELKNDIIKFKEITLYSNKKKKKIEIELESLIYRLNLLNSLSPQIPRKSYEKAKSDIDAGRASYRVDLGSDK